MAKQIAASAVALLMFLQAFACIVIGVGLANTYSTRTAPQAEGGASSFLTFLLFAVVGVLLACAAWRVVRSEVTGTTLPRWAVLVPLVANLGLFVAWAIAVLSADMSAGERAASTIVMVPVVAVSAWAAVTLRGSSLRSSETS